MFGDFVNSIENESIRVIILTWKLENHHNFLKYKNQFRWLPPEAILQVEK